MECKAVSSKDLGTNCWLAKRFCKGSRCERVFSCNYPEKVSCQAVYAELEYLREKKAKLRADIEERIRTLEEVHQEKINKLEDLHKGLEEEVK